MSSTVEHIIVCQTRQMNMIYTPLEQKWVYLPRMLHPPAVGPSVYLNGIAEVCRTFMGLCNHNVDPFLHVYVPIKPWGPGCKCVLVVVTVYVCVGIFAPITTHW